MSSLYKTDGTISVPLRLHSEHGIEAIEVALMTALMAVVVIAGLPLVGDGITSVMEGVMAVLNDASAMLE